MNSFVKFCLIPLAIALVGFGCFCFISYKDVVLANIADTTPYPFYNGDEHLIAHAGGIIDGHVYTNSREAVEASIKSGSRFIEIDFIKTSDGHYIAGHDWELVNKMTGHSGDSPLSLAEFRASKIYGKYTPMDAHDVAELLEKYPDWILVVDKARDVEAIAQAFPFKKRVILQVYALHNYFRALKNGIDYPTLRLKGGRRGIKGFYKKLIEWLNIKCVILGELSFNKNKDYIGDLHNRGVMVILYGNPFFDIVEDPAKINFYANKYLDLVDTDAVQKL